MMNINLMKKDLYLSKKYFRSVFLIIFLVLLFGKNLQSRGIYFLLIVASIYVLMSAADNYDDVKNGKYIINSLPVNRKEIVVSKYSINIIMVIVILSFWMIISNLIFYFNLPLNIKPLTIKFSLSILSFIIIYGSLNYLIYFCIGGNKGSLVKTLLYIIIWAFSFDLFGKYNKLNWGLINDMKYVVVGLFISLIVMFISMSIAIRIYDRKDF